MDEIIYSYTDDQAVDDGVLIDLGTKFRVSNYSGLFSKMADAWGKELAIDRCRGIILENAANARKFFEDDDIWDVDVRIGGENENLWLIPNEVGGITLMRKEDY